MDVRRIVVGIDASACSEAAAGWAAREAARIGCPLEVLHTSTYTELVGAPTMGAPLLQQDVAGPLLDAAVATARAAHPGLEVSAGTMQLDPASALMAETGEGTLVVVGCHGRRWLTRMLLGSVSHRVAAHAAGPVAVVHDVEVDESLPVVVGVDGAPASTAAVRLAATTADERGVPLVVVHAWLPAPVSGFDALPVPQDVVDSQEAVARTVLGDSVTVARSTAPGLRVRAELVPGSPVTALAHEAARASLVVVGTHGHEGVSGAMLGSVTSGVIDAVRCPILVTPPSS